MFIIAGLGNPSSKYDKTRHNAGFDAIDIIGEKYKIKTDTLKFKAMCGAGIIEGKKVLIMKPQTFMNLSGEAIKAAVEYYKTDVTEELIILYDDISLDVGKLRIRRKGSAGGHNGIKSIISNLGTEDFYRIKIGVGNKPPEYDLADYVLGRFSPKDRKVFEEGLNNASDAAAKILSDGIESCMNKYN